jgi:hypothetical protein
MSAHSVRRVNFLKGLNAGQSYLEVGVSKGHTFNQLSFPVKHAVDPRFRFNVNEHAKPGTHFFQMTSDDYFTSDHANISFDVIFLDGLHTYDQTYRDFCNSISHSTDKTIFIIDDTRPSDSYSAMRNQQFAVNSRQIESPLTGVPGTDAAWHGDVYKTLFLLKLFHPKLDYATLNEDNPQTIIWSKNCIANPKDATDELPFERFADMRFLRKTFENMGSIDYNWTMNECCDIFQSVAESDLFAYLGSKFRI